MATSHSTLPASRNLVLTFLRSIRARLTPIRVAIKRRMPQGLYARSLMIFITPMVILQGVVAYVFMERHWELVTEIGRAHV